MRYQSSLLDQAQQMCGGGLPVHICDGRLYARKIVMLALADGLSVLFIQHAT